MSADEQYTDEDLLRLYRSTGDNAWLGMLLPRYTLLLFGVAMKYLKNTTLAEDTVQHVFLKALTSLPSGEIQNFKGWLYVLTRNHCLHQLRDKRYNLEIEGVQVAEEEEAENELLKILTPEKVSRALSALPPEQQNCIRSFYLEKQSYQQIMDKTGLTFMQVKSYIQNGKRNLRQILLKQMRHD